MFKIGDHVILKDGAGIFTLETNKSYEVINIDQSLSIKSIHEYEYFIMVDADKETYYNIRRFKRDVQFDRKRKIKKMEW